MVLAVISLLAPSCRKDNTPQDTTPPHTIIFYFVGMSLDQYFQTNIEDTIEALDNNIQGRSRVIACCQNRKNNKMTISEFIYRNSKCKQVDIKTIDLPDMMDEQRLAEILSDVMNIAPATSYGLVIGSHGSAWLQIGAEPTTGRAADFITHEELWNFEGNTTTRYLGETNNPENIFEMQTLSSALTATGVKMDYILLDACFMSNIEALYDLRTNADYIIASPCEVINDGFPYSEVIPLLLKNEGRSHDLDGVCHAYYDEYKTSCGYSGAVALIDCSQIDNLAKAMKEVNKNLNNNYSSASTQTYDGFNKHLFFDLGDFVSKACNNEQVKSQFKAQLERTIPSRYTTTSFYAGNGNSGIYPINPNVYSGITTSQPSELYRNNYMNTSWYKATH